MIQTKYLICAGLFGAGVATGMGLGWKLWIKKPVPVTAQPGIALKGGGMILPVHPATAKEAQAASPILGLPKGAKVRERATVTLLPHLPSIPTGAPSTPGSGTAPVDPATRLPIHVNLALLDMPDGHQRIAVSSPDADVIGGMDLPIEQKHTARDLKWLAGAAYNPSDRTYGAFVMREIGPVVVGVEVNQVKVPVIAGGGTTLDGRITIGVRF